MMKRSIAFLLLVPFLLIPPVSAVKASYSSSYYSIDPVDISRIVALHKKMIRGTLEINRSGSGFCFKRSEGKSYILTCQHVVDKDVQVSISMRDGFAIRSEIGVVIYSDSIADVAIIECKNKYPIFNIASSEDWNKFMKKDRLFMSSGLPGSIRPAITTVGAFIELKANDGVEGAFHSTSGWFGFSGGPLIDVKSGKVIGINARIYYGQSNRMWAVGNPAIHDVIKWAFKPKPEPKEPEVDKP